MATEGVGWGSSSGCPGGSGRAAQRPGSPAFLVVAASSHLCLRHLHGCLLHVSPSILTSPYKDTHHWIEGPPSSSLIWRDRGVSVENLGVPSWGVGDTAFKVAAGGALPFFVGSGVHWLLPSWPDSWWKSGHGGGCSQPGWFNLPATGTSTSPDGTILPGSNQPCGQRPTSALLLLEGPEVSFYGDGGTSTCGFAGTQLAPISESSGV